MIDSKEIRAVLFDMDGLLLDSERVGVDVSLECADIMGVDMTKEEVLSTLGVTREKLKQIYTVRNPSLDLDRFLELFSGRMSELAREGKIPLKKGARRLLELLEKRGIPCALASSSPLSIVRVYLASHQIGAYFSAVVSGDDHLPSKPAPDMFLEAARRISSPIGNCLVLEDSENGIKSGRNSGAKVIMIPDMIPFRDEFAPFTDAVLPSLDDVAEMLEA